MDKSQETPKVMVAIETMIVLLAFFSLFLFAFEIFGSPDPDQLIAIRYADLSIAFVFLAEFAVRFFLQNDKVSFLKSKWWMLLAALPVTSAGTSALRGIQILRIFYILRFVGMGARANFLLKNVLSFFRQTYLASTLLFVIFLIIGGTFSIFLVESHVNPNFNNLGTSLWWTISSVTTTGVQVEPVTFAGKVVGMILMFGGVVTLGVFTASIASYIIRKHQGQTRSSQV